MSELHWPARTLVIPMKDEASRIEHTLRALAGSSAHYDDTELILVDDGSTDGTPEISERLLQELNLEGHVVRLGRNLGKGGAIRAGIAAARGQAIAFSDADLSAPPDAIDACFTAIESGIADVVVTTRLHDDSNITVQPPLARRLGGKLFNALLRKLGLTAYADTQCGLKAFTEKAADMLFRDLRIQRFAFDVEVLLRAELAGLRVVEQPIEWQHKDSSRVRPLRDGTRMAVDVLRLRRSLRAWRPTPDSGDFPSMDEDRFPVMARLEREHWWFRAKRTLAVDALRDLGIKGGAAADIGCGTGAMVAELATAGFSPVIGLDASSVALRFASDHHVGDQQATLAAASASRLPFSDNSLCCVTSLDVIEHLDDDVHALLEYARVVEPGGVVIVAVPAYQWAWSDHDVVLGHRRRYNSGQLERVAITAGLEVARSTYYHGWLVPLAFMLRRTPLRLLLRSSAEEASFVSPRVNRLLLVLVGTERWIARRIRIPMGLSILLVARKPVAPVADHLQPRKLQA